MTEDLKTQTADERLTEAGITLPSAPKPAGNYALMTRSNGVCYLSGQGPITEGRVVFGGKVGADISVEDGYQAARLAAINALAVLKSELGSLDRVRRVLKVLGWICCNEGFHQQPSVLNGASDLLMQVFGERGRHARSAVSAHDLPFGIAVELEMVVEVD